MTGFMRTQIILVARGKKQKAGIALAFVTS